MRPNHPEWQHVLDALETPTAASRPILEHVEKCADCGRVAGGVRELLDTFALARAPRPPAELIERALAVILTTSDAWARARGFLAAGLRAVRAILVTDSLAPSAAFRGTAVAQPRLLLYETPVYSVSLSIEDGDASSSVDLRGQVAPRQGDAIPGGGRALLLTPDSHRICPLSAFGEFAFTDVQPGRLLLAIEIGDERLEVGPFAESTTS